MKNSKTINGLLLAKKITQNLAEEIHIYTTKYFLRSPVLCTILVGNNSASKIYIKNKNKQATCIGIINVNYQLDEQVSESDLLDLINRMNDDRQIDGILVQLPLPKHIETEKILKTIIPTKDVDGFHPENVGLLSIGKPNFIPCTPKGCIALINSVDKNLIGKNAVIIGKSNIVGKPMAQVLINEQMTVTICNSNTKNIKYFTKNADILVTATGIPHLIGPDFIKQNSIVLDIGISRLSNGNIVGDVDTEAVLSLVKAITPVPGGVGPMTLAMLMENTLKAYKKHVVGD